MNEEGAKLKENWITKAETLLGSGKGHMGIIGYLRDQGLHADDAKRVSYEIFDEAKKRLMRNQRGYQILGWLLIALGILGPLILFVLQARVVVISGAPLIGGVILLGKVVNPSRLPD